MVVCAVVLADFGLLVVFECIVGLGSVLLRRILLI